MLCSFGYYSPSGGAGYLMEKLPLCSRREVPVENELTCAFGTLCDIKEMFIIPLFDTRPSFNYRKIK